MASPFNNPKEVNPFQTPIPVFIPTPAIEFVPSDPIPNSKFTDYLEGDNEVNSAGDTVKENRSHIHFSATSQREFGKRYAYIFNSI